MQELTAIANSHILKANGFEIRVEEDLPAGERVHLLTLPVLKGCQFGDQGIVCVCARL